MLIPMQEGPKNPRKSPRREEQDQDQIHQTETGGQDGDLGVGIEAQEVAEEAGLDLEVSEIKILLKFF